MSFSYSHCSDYSNNNVQILTRWLPKHLPLWPRERLRYLRFSLWLAALRAHQSTDEAEPSNTTPTNPDPIIISSDSKSEEVLEYILGAEPMEDEEEAPEYVPANRMMENQDQAEEDLEQDHEMDPKEDPKKDPEEEPKEDLEEELEEELEEDPEEDPNQDPEDEEMEVVVNLQPGDDECDEYFADYFELAPPPSPDSSAGSPSPEDD
ncbi:hypothetical protein PIB30_063122 [Stylosanthes scabra]|uniref:Uncharacterized protein n=1 Tax=Stylosanthes scabra TaxID=79078 RepID=A0ABU6WM15_9FABA|nr:hypothetical protein [Stylosanthes scabra]